MFVPLILLFVLLCCFAAVWCSLCCCLYNLLLLVRLLLFVFSVVFTALFVCAAFFVFFCFVCCFYFFVLFFLLFVLLLSDAFAAAFGSPTVERHPLPILTFQNVKNNCTIDETPLTSENVKNFFLYPEVTFCIKKDFGVPKKSLWSFVSQKKDFCTSQKSHPVEERQLGQLGGLFADGPTTPSQDCSLVCGPLEWTTTHPFFRAALEATLHLAGAGFEAPTWDALARGARSGHREPEEIEPGAMHPLKSRSTREASCSVEYQIK